MHQNLKHSYPLCSAVSTQQFTRTKASTVNKRRLHCTQVQHSTVHTLAAPTDVGVDSQGIQSPATWKDFMPLVQRTEQQEESNMVYR